MITFLYVDDRQGGTGTRILRNRRAFSYRSNRYLVYVYGYALDRASCIDFHKKFHSECSSKGLSNRNISMMEVDWKILEGVLFLILIRLEILHVWLRLLAHFR